MPGLFVGLLLGLSQVDREADAHVAFAGMPRLLPGPLVCLDVLLEIGKGENARGIDEQGESHPADDGKGLGGGDAHPYRRVRILVGLGPYRDVIALVVLALKGELLGGPGLEDDIEVFLETAPALGVGREEGVVVLREGAAADAEVEPALADVVEGGDFLGDADGIAEGQQEHAEADADALGAAGDGGGHHDRGGEDAERDEVVFGQPDGLHAHLLRFRGDPESLLKGLLISYFVKRRELKKQSGLHGASSCIGGAANRPG